ncbi:hypothetical protein [Natronobiforma cellulositropha]|uniref:hypothetical protein n=1 Tax=Natronobiforma cellulositropha TaxID=1679076 RepID=UPI0021D5B221|nr:hypothetical protein [Natronobiforma cellulositropha]
MSTHPTVREVFADVEPDPDAVLEAFGAEAPEDVLDDESTDASAAEESAAVSAATDRLFGDLESVSLDAPTDADGPDDGSAPLEGDVFVSDPTVVVEDGERRETPPTAETQATHSADGLTLVGPPPTPVRVRTDTFGVDVAEAFDPVRGA